NSRCAFTKFIVCYLVFDKTREKCDKSINLYNTKVNSKQMIIQFGLSSEMNLDHFGGQNFRICVEYKDVNNKHQTLYSSSFELLFTTRRNKKRKISTISNGQPRKISKMEKSKKNLSFKDMYIHIEKNEIHVPKRHSSKKIQIEHCFCKEACDEN